MGLKNNELDLDKLEQIADILWLSKYIDKVEVIEVDNNIIDESNNSTTDSSSQNETDIEEEEEREEEITSNETTKSSSDASLYTNDKKNNQPTNIKADPIKAPKKLSMSSYRDWEKCFKLLRHKVDSKKEFLLDEEETVETIAKTHLYQPVFRAKKINYFDLIMIIDKNDSMEIWSELVNEFQKTIQRFGIFRQIYFYYMLSNQEDVKLFADKNMQREVSYEKLNLNGRTLVTVVSDCVSTGWHNNQIFSMIELWSERSSTSIVQMFPKRMWQGTSLYKGLQTSFSSIKFNPLNKHLKSDEDEFYDNDDKTLNIPVINFDPRSFESWGSVILGKRKKWIDGILLEDIEVLEKLDLISEEQEITAEERVDRYFSQASPLAQKLAIYASLLPINFHVIRILQELQLPDSTQIHLAEFFLGALIKRDIIEIDGKKVVSYSFYSDQVQEMLRGMLANPIAYSIQKKMSSFVATHINSSLDFQALMDNPESISGLYLNEEDIAFVKLRAETLRGLGGQYAKRAEILIEGVSDKKKETITVVRVFLELENGSISRFNGTAFFIDSNTVVTTKYVLESSSTTNYKIYLYDLPNEERLLVSPASIKLCEGDMAIINLSKKFDIPKVKFTNNVRLESSLKILGYHEEEEQLKIYSKTVVGFNNILKSYELQGYVSLGMGGSPVLLNNQVCGIVNGRHKNDNITYVKAIEEVCIDTIKLEKNNPLSNDLKEKSNLIVKILIGEHRHFNGTGFFINSNTIVIAKHTVAIAIDKKESIYINELPNNETLLITINSIKLCEKDIAIITLEKEFEIPLIEFTNELQVESNIKTLGYYNNNDNFRVCNSDIVGYSSNLNYYEMEEHISNGMSGSPVFIDNKVCGMIFSKSSKNNLTYIMPIEEFCIDIFGLNKPSSLEKSLKNKNIKVVSILIENPSTGEIKANGTAFFINENTVIILRNIIEKIINTHKIYLTNVPNKEDILITSDLIEFFDDKIAIVNLPFNIDVPVVSFSNNLEVELNVKILGYHSKNSEISVYTKKMIGITSNSKHYQLEGYVHLGMSGSPVLVNDKLCGILYAINKNKNISYVLPIENFSEVWEGTSKSLFNKNKKDLEKTVDRLLSSHLGLFLSRKYDDDSYLRKEIRNILIIKGFELKILNIKKNNFDLIEEIKKIFEINENDLSFESQLDKKIKSITKKTILIIENYDFIDIKIEERFISLLMTLTSDYENFPIIMFGGKELAKYVYGSFDREYFSNANVFFIEDINNPINDNISNEIKNITGMNPRLLQLYVDNKIENKTSNEYKNFLISSNIMKELFENISSMNQLKQYLENDNFGFYNPGIQDEFIRELFWENLLKEENGRMVWRSDFIKEMGKKLLSQTFSYQITKGVENPSMFFGREKIIKNITQRTPRNYLIVGARRVGKSSLLKALHRTYLKNKTVKSFYFTLADSNLKKKIIDELTPKDKNINSFSELKLYLKQQDKKYVCLIDEVDDFIEYDKNKNYEFLKSLREMSEEGYISFVLAGFWQLYKSKFDHQSPLLNFGDFIEIGELEHDACYDLIKKPMSMMNIVFEEDFLIDDIVSKLGHKAYLISLISIELLEDKIGIDGKENALITKKDVERVFKNSKKIRTELVQWVKLEDDKKGELLRRLIMYGMLKNDFFELEDVQKFLKNHDIYIYLSDVEYHLELLVLSFFFKKEIYSYSFRIPLQRELLLEDNIDMQIREAVFSLKREDI